MLQAPAQAQVQAFGGLPLLEHEQRQAVGVGLRHKGFFAEGGELVAADLGANHPFDRPQRLVPGFDPRLVTLVLEGGMHLAAFNLAVLVVGVAKVDLHRAERTVEVAQFRGEAVMILLHVQAHARFGHRAVVGVIAAVGKAGIAMIPMVGTTQRAAILATVAVLQAVFAARFVGVAHFRAAGVAGNAQVIELAAVGVQVQGEAAVTGLQLAGAAAGGVGTAIAQFARPVNAVDGRGRDAVVEAVDHPADGVAAVEQCGRAADDFDALDGGRVQWHGVVIRQRRGIQGADTVAQDTDTVAVQTADHRAAGTGAEPGRGDAGLVVQGLAEAAFLLQGQVVAVEYGAGRGQFAVAQRVGGDHLGLQLDSLTQGRGEPERSGKGGEAQG
ncbi:hypothetical protein D3C81_818340 [compost metagenome]